MIKCSPKKADKLRSDSEKESKPREGLVDTKQTTGREDKTEDTLPIWQLTL